VLEEREITVPSGGETPLADGAGTPKPDYANYAIGVTERTDTENQCNCSVFTC